MPPESDEPAGGRREEVASLDTTTSQLLDLADWLGERRVPLVGMEATGIYWKPVHWVLEGSLPEVWVINARHMRNVPGRKTDVNDAIWGASLIEHGLVRPSFIPPEPFRALRDMTRYRKAIVSGLWRRPHLRHGPHRVSLRVDIREDVGAHESPVVGGF